MGPGLVALQWIVRMSTRKKIGSIELRSVHRTPSFLIIFYRIWWEFHNIFYHRWFVYEVHEPPLLLLLSKELTAVEYVCQKRRCFEAWSRERLWLPFHPVFLSTITNPHDHIKIYSISSFFGCFLEETTCDTLFYFLHPFWGYLSSNK